MVDISSISARKSVFSTHSSSILIVSAIIGTLGTASALSGCNRPLKMPWNQENPDSRVNQAPPIWTDTINERHLLLMQAPNPGWSFTLDQDERMRDSTRVYLSIVKPDPSFVYPQVIVEKTVLTDIPSQRPLEIFARVIDANEKKSRRAYHQLELQDKPTD